ncbi:MAG: SIS domain-containing protein [Pyrodictiaceae archaeon]
MTMFALRLREDLSRALGLLEDQYRSAPRLEPNCFLAVGAGDSYAAALAASASPTAHVAAIDPLEAVVSGITKRMASEGCWMLAISVGGRTREVLRAVEKYRGLGGRVVAITGDPESPLARVANETVTLLSHASVMGVGAGRQLLVLAALAGLLGSKPPSSSWRPRAPCISFPTPIVYTGAGEGLASAVYAAMKAYEVFGVGSRWFHLEQLVHAPVFSVSEPIIVFSSSLAEAGSRVSEVADTLGEAGYVVHVIEAAEDPWTTAIGQAAYIVECLASTIESMGLDHPRYQDHPELKRLTQLIYQSS